jgi:hypothetical protein
MHMPILGSLKMTSAKNRLQTLSESSRCSGNKLIFVNKNFMLGVDIMITIFCDFQPIFGEKYSVFLKNQCYDSNFVKITSILTKNAIFHHLFGENIFKIITSVPGYVGTNKLHYRVC